MINRYKFSIFFRDVIKKKTTHIINIFENTFFKHIVVVQRVGLIFHMKYLR